MDKRPTIIDVATLAGVSTWADEIRAASRTPEGHALGERSSRWPDRGLRYLATRFSAKEAFSKAIGLGMRMPMTWRSCEITNLPSGKPVIVLHGELKAWFEAQGLRAHVTVTDETDYAASFVVVERD